jgi:hypothetical protein
MVRNFHAARGGRMLFVLLTGLACLVLQGCHPSCYDSDQTLRDRFFRNRADFDELIRLFQSQPANEKLDDITANTNPPYVPKPAVPSATWTKIHDLLIKLKADRIARNDRGIDVEVDVRDAGLTNGVYYFFLYCTTVPDRVVPSLYQAKPYHYGGKRPTEYMPLDGNWYAYAYED